MAKGPIGEKKSQKQQNAGDAIKEHSTKLAKGVIKHTTILGKGVAEGSAVLGDGVLKGSKLFGEGVVEGSKIVAQGSKAIGKGVVHGTELLGKGTIAAAKGIKEGAEKGYKGFKHFLMCTADKLHLKKPDMQAFDEYEESPYLPTEVAKRWYQKNVKLQPKKGKGKLVLKWNRVFCWHDDPFKLDVMQPIDDFFVCDKKKKSALNMFLVKEYLFGCITGDKGAGKTSFLHWIHWELEAHHPEVIACFVDATSKKIGQRSLTKQVMEPFLNIYQMTVSRPFEEITPEDLGQYVKRKVGGKQFVLLIDEPHNIGNNGVAIIEALEKAKVKLQVIIAGEKKDLAKVFLMKNHKDMLKFDLGGLDVELAKELLRKRIEAVGGEGTYPFDGHRIATLVKHAKGNPSTLLQSAKEKSIRLSVDQRDKIIAEQIERIRAREQAIKQKYLANKERKREEKEQKRLAIEKEREERMEAEERKRVQEIKHHEKILASEDMQLGKIDDMIGSILGGKGKAKEEKEVKEDTSELDKHKELVEKAVGNVPEEKNADQILKEDPSLLDDLKLVLEETEEATKHKKKKRRSK